MNTFNLDKALADAKRSETAELVNLLLDAAEFFSDVETWAIEHGGFTVENLQEAIGEGGPIHLYLVGYSFKPERVDWEAAVRSLNEEFGYGQHSEKVYLRLSSYRVDELGRERFDCSHVTPEWSPGDDIEVYLEKVRGLARLLVQEHEKAKTE